MPVDSLSGYAVLVTRPADSSKNLLELIRAEGGTAFEFPVIKIEPLAGNPAMRSTVSNLEDLDLVVFVSVHAVRSFAETMDQEEQRMPDDLKVAAVGPTTAAELNLYGYSVDFLPEKTASSESLIEKLSNYPQPGHNVAIFRGQSGREHLSQYLHDAGASVTEVESYRRLPNPASLDPILSGWLQCPDRLLTLTSVDIMQRFIEKVPEESRGLVFDTDIAALSERIAVACRNAGFSARIHVADSSDDRGLLRALIACALDPRD